MRIESGTPKWSMYNKLMTRRNAYRRLFYGPDGNLTKDGEIVLRDLRTFCRRKSILVRLIQDARSLLLGQTDPFAMANANGRREVYDRVTRHLHLKDETEIQLETPDED